MNISVTNKTKSQKQIEATISADEMQPYLSRAIKELGAGLQLPGFRKGNAPAGLIRSTLGEGKVWEEAAEYALQGTLEKACVENALDIVSSPSIEVLQLAPGNDFRYRATFEVIPPFTLCDVRAAARRVYDKERRDVSVSEKEVEDALQWLAKSRAAFQEVSREARKGDAVEIRYEGKIGGVTQEGLEQRSERFLLGEDQAPDGLETAILGMKKGEEKDASISFPDNFPDVHLRGKAVDMRIVLKNIQERSVPVIDDAFVKTLGGFRNVDELKKSIEEGMRTEKEKREEERVGLLQLEEIARASGVVVPAVLAEQELERMKEEFSRELAQIGTTLASYLEQIRKTEDDLKKGWAQKAEERVSAGLVLRAIAKQEHIEADEKEVEERANAVLGRYKNKKEAEEREGSPESLRARIAGSMRNEKVLELIHEGIATSQ